MDNYIFPLFDPFDILINIVLFAQKGRILSGTQCFFGKKKKERNGIYNVSASFTSLEVFIIFP